MAAIEVAMRLLEIVLRLVGNEKATELLVSQVAINQANAAADAIEAVRFPEG